MWVLVGDYKGDTDGTVEQNQSQLDVSMEETGSMILKWRYKKKKT